MKKIIKNESFPISVKTGTFFFKFHKEYTMANVQQSIKNFEGKSYTLYGSAPLSKIFAFDGYHIEVINTPNTINMNFEILSDHNFCFMKPFLK